MHSLGTIACIKKKKLLQHYSVWCIRRFFSYKKKTTVHNILNSKEFSPGILYFDLAHVLEIYFCFKKWENCVNIGTHKKLCIRIANYFEHLPVVSSQM